MDVASILLQLLWTKQVVGDVLGIVHSDLHHSNIAIRVAPFGGYYSFRFQVRGSTGDVMTVTLKTHLKLTIIDWAIFKLCKSYGSATPLDRRLLYAMVGKEAPLDKGSETDSRALESSTFSHFRADVNQALFVDTWPYLLQNTGIGSIARGMHPIRCGERSLRIENLSSLSWRGIALWSNLCAHFDGLRHQGEFVSVEPFATAPDPMIPLNCFDLKEFEEWAPALSDLISSTLPLPSPLSSQLPSSCAGASPITTTVAPSSTPLSASSSSSMRPSTHRRAQNRDRLSKSRRYNDLDDDMKRRPMWEEFPKPSLDLVPTSPSADNLYILHDSSLIEVRPLPTGRLGVFAKCAIPSDAIITCFPEVHPNISLNAQNTTIITPTPETLTSNEEQFFDSLRFPCFGSGVASLSTSSSSEETSNTYVDLLSLSKSYNEGLTLVLKSKREIAPGEELITFSQPITPDSDITDQTVL